MKSVKQLLSLRRLSIVVASSALAACGAGSDQAQNTSSSAQTAATFSSSAAGILTGPITTTVPPSTGTNTSPTTVSGTGITDVRFENTSATLTQTNVPVTFGQVFAQGHLLATDKLTGRLDDGSTVPLQVDVKATHADGSVRHAIISAIVPSIAPAQVRTMSLVKGGTAPTGTVTTDSLMRTGFSTSVHAKIGGVDYYASADDLLKSTAPTTWLNGPIATEWEVSAPLRTASGAQHPHLSARFAIRWYAGANKARVDVVLENGWAYEAAPQNFTYDASVLVGGKSVYAQAGLSHYHHARWRKVFWYNNTAPELNVQQNTAYLIASRAIPNYDQSLKITDAAIASWNTKWTNSKTGPMNVGVGQAYMPTTGGRPDLGLMPAWNALYVLSMDKRMKTISLGMSEQAGSWSSHYRNKTTGRPVTLVEFPYMTTLNAPGDTLNPATRLREAFPACATTTACTTPNTADTSHQAGFSYLPYLLTGDYYHLEELQFWANFSSFASNPAYREWGKGLVKSDQVRGQAWTLRTLAEAAYITPDNDPQKANFTAMVNNNIDWYNANYTNSSTANKLGALEHGYAIIYNSNTGLAPWQDDFFTASIGHMVELGFTGAQPLLTWKSKFSVDRMVGTGYCWIQAPAYSLNVRATSTSSVYTTIGQVYEANGFSTAACGSAAMGTALKLRAGEMVGYVTPDGAASIIQPALAYATANNANGAKAWSLFAARPFKPDYTSQPQFAIVPR
jgi:hypothetical protein